MNSLFYELQGIECEFGQYESKYFSSNSTLVDNCSLFLLDAGKQLRNLMDSMDSFSSSADTFYHKRLRNTPYLT